MNRHESKNLIKGWGLLLLSLGIVLLVFFGLRDADPGYWVEGFSRVGPLPFFIAFAVLPAFGFPVTPFLLLAGAAHGVWLSLVGLGLAYLVNLSLSYWLARRYMRAWVERWLSQTRYRIPELNETGLLRFGLLVRITPGPPSWLKSSILGLSGIPYKLYLLSSWPICMGYAAGVIVLGDSFTDGDWGQALLGLSILAGFIVLLAWVRNRLEARQAHSEADGPTSTSQLEN